MLGNIFISMNFFSQWKLFI